MLTCVIGFPVALCMGMALTSIFDVETGGKSAPEGLCSSFLGGATLTEVSLTVDLWGMFLISLYLDCLS